MIKRPLSLLLLLFAFPLLGCALVSGLPSTATAVPTRVTRTPTPLPTPNPLVTEPYISCYADISRRKNFTLFPGDSCADEACVDAGLEAEAYAAWKQFMMESHQLDAESYEEHIEIADVSIQEFSSDTWVWVRYVVVNEWARDFREHAMRFAGDPDADMLREAAEKTFVNNDQVNLPEVVTVAEIETVFAECDSELDINWCSMTTPTLGGRLYVTGFRDLDVEPDRCIVAAVYVDTGEVWYCREESCGMDE
jgi:hypothetical protein